MKQNFQTQMLGLIAAMIGLSVVSAFAIVWMQQQISRTASQCSVLEDQLIDRIRKVNYLDERIAEIHQPAVLQSKVMGQLRPSTDRQIVWVQEQTVGERRAYVLSGPYRTSLDLALLDLQP